MDWSKYYPANYSAITEADIEMIREKRKIETPVEDNTNDEPDDGEGLDKVQPKALKKKFDKRKDTDIDNDGDTDDSDEFIHTKRKAISKAVEKEEIESEGLLDPEARAKKAAMLQKKQSDPAHQAAQARKKQAIAKDPAAIEREKRMRQTEDVAMCPDECCGTPVSECTCPADCPHCDCNAVNEMSKDEYKDSNMKKDQEKKKKKGDPEETEFSKKQDTVTNMEAVDHGKPGAVDIYKETIALAKVTRGRDKLSLEGAAKLIKQRSYDKLAPYLDSMEEEPRQSVLMILMNDQKIADKVMKKMKTEKYHGWLMSEMHQKYDGLTWAEIGERLIRTPERRLVSLAYATKMGTIDAPSPEVQKLADECELADLEKAAGSIIGEDDDLDEAKSDAEKIADKQASNNKIKQKSANQDNQADTKKADKARETQANANDKEQEKRQAQADKEREAKKKQQAAARARQTDDPTIKRDGGPSTTRSKIANIAFAALEGTEEEVPETIDARRRVFKEKIRKLAYEKAKELIAKQQSAPDPTYDEAKKEEEDSDEIGSKVKETGKVDNKIKMEPIVKESTGVSFVRKYKQKMAAEQKDGTLENNILEYLAGSSFGGVGQANPVGAEFASDDSPASATSIARALKCSPMQVQKLLDDMLEAGQISRVGDAYSYASPRPAEPQGEKEDSGLEV